ncbi:MAG: VCBS repeat-containing protein, partial [FCB group bacterium]|nr:VCBS repeat-containing protein [FCB group bacterium]
MTKCHGTILLVGCMILSLLSRTAEAQLPEYTFEVWGRTSYGDGYVYGPPYRSSGVTVVDLDADNDYDFVMPSLTGPPQVMRNLGNNRAFYPGGQRPVNMDDPAPLWYLGRYMDFADVDGDGLPDAVAVCNNYVGGGGSAIYVYLNEGPRETPHFTPRAIPVYTSPQSGRALGAVDLVDLNGDGAYEIAFVEFTMNPPSAAPKVYYLPNTGTIRIPAWGDRTELTPLSDLMPEPRTASKSDRNETGPWLLPKDRYIGVAKTTYVDVVTDMEFGDWDADGDIDFLFYNSEDGVHWSRCIDRTRALTDPARWDATLDVEVIPYTQSAFFEHVQGAFAVRPGPDVSSYPDFYVAVQGMLLTWRYNARGEQYELIQQNAVAFDAGTGSPAFWDYDSDGDLDMFRIDDMTGQLSVVANVGTPYSAIWDYATALAAPVLGLGTSENRYRQDLYAFADGDGDGNTELFVQGQDGEIRIHAAHGNVPGFVPWFDAAEGPYFSIVPPGALDVQARGLAVADFNGSEDGVLEIIAAIGWKDSEDNDEGALYYLSQDTENFAPNLTHWKPVGEIVLKDENGQSLWPGLIENVAATDVDRDGRPDLVLTLSEQFNYEICTHHVWRNVLHTDTSPPSASLDYAGTIAATGEYPYYARNIGFADIDTDGDDDLFVAHQYIDPTEPTLEFSRYPYLHFYRNGSDTGLLYWQTRVVAGQEWTFTINSQAASFRYIFNGSGGNITNGVYTAGPNAQTVDIIESTDANPNYRIFIDVLEEVGDSSKAVFLVGGDSDDALYPAFTELVKRGYDSLLLQGLPKENIRILAGLPIDGDGDEVSDTFAPPTLPGLRSAITRWGYGTNRMLVYMVDHGQQNRFRVNGVDYLGAAEYASWVTQLQATTPAPVVTTVLDMCEAGSFVDELAMSKDARKNGIKRITITGSNIGPTEGVAMFDQEQSVSFSLPFWEQIWNGMTYGEAFSTAKVNIESINPLQVPQIDDNGNGVPNELSDGLVAATARPGADFDRPAPAVYIGEIKEPQAITSNTATLWLSDVVAGFPVDGAGALIVPPNLNRSVGRGDDEQPVSGMIWVDFTWNAAEKRWEAPYAGFTTGGLYRIQYYVSILNNYHASPRIGFVDRVAARTPGKSTTRATLRR